MYSYYNNFIFLFILILNIQSKETVYEFVKEGEVSKIYLKSIMDVHLIINSNYSPMLIHFLSIDCEIEIVNEDKEDFIDIKKISNFNYYASSVLINDTESYLNIIPLINSSKELNPNRNYPLIINQIFFGNSGIPQLKVKENEPIFLCFNDNLNLINLIYYFGDRDIQYPIIISFFIKEKIKFKIEISHEHKKSIINRIINYKENIIIKPESYKTYNISITPEEDIISTTMFVKIIHNNSFPFNLERNQLNSGFISKNIDYYYYYMEVYKGEEGEIILFNKKQNGILIAKNVTSYDIPNVHFFPKYNEIDALNNKNLGFNVYNQKISFNSSHTEYCYSLRCYLLITYYSNISKDLDINGTEFSILSRVWDKGNSHIINIPLNEYIFGIFDESSFNIHYYSVFIPYDTKNIYIEIDGMNIIGYSHKGIIQINKKNKDSNTTKLFDKCQNKMIINLKSKDIGLDSFGGEYISFAFEKNSIDIHSYYYFRILQQNYENDSMIYPLDTNKENYCEAINNKCYFLLKNEYSELLNKIVIYSFGENDVSYKVFLMNDEDYYSTNLNINNLNKVKEIESFNGHLILNLKKKERFILILVESNLDKNFKIISNFYNQSNFPSIDIYSYQLYHLSEGHYQQFNLIQNPLKKYRILINNTEGEGYICFNQTCNNNNNYIHITEQKIYSFSIFNNTNFFIYAKNNLTYNIKIIYEISNEIIKELNYQYNYEKIDLNKEIFPLIYFIKDVKYNGININFIFKFNDSNNAYNNFIIKVIGIDYSEILSIKDKNDIDCTNEMIGKYDNITNSGTIELSKELIQTKYKDTYRYTEDKYFMIIIKNITSFNFNNLINDIYVFSKDENYILLPINKYIRNSFNLIEDKTIIQKFFFEKENITNNKFILEFSSNYESIELTFSELMKNSTPKIIGGFKQYILSINSDNSNDYYFNVVIKPTNKSNEEKSLKDVNIIIKYYNEDKKIDIDYICNKTFIYEKTKNTEKNSNYTLIINNNTDEIVKYSNELNYNYYLRLIKKSNLLINEELNTIALISSKLSYINKFDSTETEFYLNNLENNETYIASFFIKIENINDGEKYCSLVYEFNKEEDKERDENKENPEKTNNNNGWIIILIIIITLIIVLILFFIIYRKIRIKSGNIEDKINDVDFSYGLNEDLINNQELSNKERKSGNYLNVSL